MRLSCRIYRRKVGSSPYRTDCENTYIYSATSGLCATASKGDTISTRNNQK